ncbi:UNVERIFIED_CONTAM: hypothetical protein PYX00_001210 [Menopon gallinae]|uniref:Uncharacterized protein n=1 Tax=Menopon gallinae TaxID=328185 RepID=A0AAW2ID88_9NEOP
MWKKKMLWKPRWIKEWKSSNVLKPVWRKFWGPVIIREWVPIPKPPPQWDASSVVPEQTPTTAGTAGPPPIEPPTPNLSYLPQPVPFNGYNYDPPKKPFDPYKAAGSLSSGSFGYQVPHLPVSNGFNSQAESYKGHSSYGGGADGSAYDLNPPVEAFNPQLSDYSRKPSTGSYSQNGNSYSGPPSPVPQVHTHPHPHHHHHHHHHHQVRFPTHDHGRDLTKFPPDWSSWKPLSPQTHPRSPSLAQAGSAVTVAVRSTTPEPIAAVTDHLQSLGFESTTNDFIQQAALVSEFHYSEPAPVGPSPLPDPAPKPSAAVPLRIPAQELPQTTTRTHIRQPPPAQEPPPTTTRSPVRQPPPPRPRGQTPPPRPNLPSPPRYQNAIPPQKYLKPIAPPFPPNGTKPSPPVQLQKLPDFKALPTASVEAFHFVEGLPSNQTLTKAALIGNINQTGLRHLAESNQILIITPKPPQKKVAPHIAKLAQAVVQEHIKKVQKLNASTTVQTTTERATTERTIPVTVPVTVVLPTTSNSIKKTLKAYLADEATAAKTTNVFIVTPVPQKATET